MWELVCLVGHFNCEKSRVLWTYRLTDGTMVTLGEDKRRGLWCCYDRFMGYCTVYWTFDAREELCFVWCEYGLYISPTGGQPILTVITYLSYRTVGLHKLCGRWMLCSFFTAVRWRGDNDIIGGRWSQNTYIFMHLAPKPSCFGRASHTPTYTPRCTERGEPLPLWNMRNVTFEWLWGRPILKRVTLE